MSVVEVARDRLRPLVFEVLAAFTAATVKNAELKLLAKRLGARASRILSGELRGHAFINPVGQRSPAYVVGTFESHIHKAMRSFVRPGDVVIDVGANVGWHTMALARCSGVAGEVLAFEPSPIDRDILAGNVGANGYGNVLISDRAITSASGMVEFACFASPGVHHVLRDDSPIDGTVIRVPSTSLDDLVYREGVRAPSFLKVDVEGGELDVLRGARRLMREARPVLVVEVRRGETWQGIEELLADLDYRMIELHGNQHLADVLMLGLERQAPVSWGGGSAL